MIEDQELQGTSQWVKVAVAADVLQGKVKSARVGDRKIALVNLGGTIYALDAACPHKLGPLDQGDLKGDGELVCPWHQFRFDPRTGETTMPVGTYPAVPVHEVRIDGDDVEILLDRSGD